MAFEFWGDKEQNRIIFLFLSFLLTGIKKYKGERGVAPPVLREVDYLLRTILIVRTSWAPSESSLRVAV
jgi:hypothetical protein